MAKQSLPNSFSIDNLEFAPHPPAWTPFIDLTGLHFDRLTVLGFKGRARGHSWWWCLCSCGKVTPARMQRLRLGKKKSCGCWKVETDKIHSLVHGQSTGPRTPEYRAWQNMLNRCRNPRVKKYPLYGGRGITVCDRWRESFQNFFADMGRKPTAKHSLDRIDVDGNYEPANCRWATSAEQRLNQRRMQ
jgi:hypothetical protein